MINSANLTIDGQKDCYILDSLKLVALQTSSNSTKLEPGSYKIRIISGEFSYWSGGDRLFPPEPWVMLWIYGGQVINQKTGKMVACTWSCLNGYEDILQLKVLENTRITALFFDTYAHDNQGSITLEIVRNTDNPTGKSSR
jgi:hypothetical protein